jgi:hypothetical protein
MDRSKKPKKRGFNDWLIWRAGNNSPNRTIGRVAWSEPGQVDASTVWSAQETGWEPDTSIHPLECIGLIVADPPTTDDRRQSHCCYIGWQADPEASVNMRSNMLRGRRLRSRLVPGQGQSLEPLQVNFTPRVSGILVRQDGRKTVGEPAPNPSYPRGRTLWTDVASSRAYGDADFRPFLRSGTVESSQGVVRGSPHALVLVPYFGSAT